MWFILPRVSISIGLSGFQIRAAAVVIALSGWLLGPAAHAQPRTRLTLVDQIPEPGASAVKGQPLPAGTQVVVLFENESEFHTLSNLGTSHSELAQRIRDGSGMTMRLQEGGQTPESFGTTENSGKIYYLLARTGEGKLYESYVYSGVRGFRPGFGAVQNGDIKMGPVPEEHRDTLRAALESVFSTGHSGGGERYKRSSGGKKGEAEKQTETASDDASSSTESTGTGLAMSYFLLGLLFGIGGMWFVHRVSSRKSEKHIRDMESKIRKLKEALVQQKDGSEGHGAEEAQSQDADSGIQSTEGPTEDEATESEVSQGQGAEVDAGSVNADLEGAADRKVVSVGEVFRNWCQETEGEQRRDIDQFQNRITSRIPNAEVLKFYREKYADGLVFAQNAREPVEYWLVRIEARGFLLPAPSPSGFHEVGKCFDGDVGSPEEVQVVLPAELVGRGGRGGTVEQQGYISDDSEEEADLDEVSEHAEDHSTAEEIGDTFVDWCRTKETMIGRYYMFEQTLQESLTEAEVSPIYRRTDMENGYSFDADNTSEEYWLVETKGGDWLLPAPQKRDRFLALGRAFQESEGSPSALTEIRPAQVTSEGAHYELQEPGRLQEESSAQQRNAAETEN